MVPPAAEFNDLFAFLLSTALTFSKKTAPTKTIEKTNGFTNFSHVRVCAHITKIIGKSLRTCVSSDSRHRELSKDEFFGSRNTKMALKVSPGRLGRPPAAALRHSWPPTSLFWRALGRPLAASGPLLGALGWLLTTLLLANYQNFVCSTGLCSIWAPFGQEILRNSANNLRNPGENLRPSPRIECRIPTRVRRSREANSIYEHFLQSHVANPDKSRAFTLRDFGYIF